MVAILHTVPGQALQHVLCMPVAIDFTEARKFLGWLCKTDTMEVEDEPKYRKMQLEMEV